jgi:mRNA-degrading endonuclease RelE of RelBE toxin-antitoxin system
VSHLPDSGHDAPPDHPRFIRTARFKRAYRKLGRRDQERVKSALAHLAADRSYPSLRVKRVQGTHRVWEMRAGRDIRITSEIDQNTYILRNVGHHDATLKNP